MSGAARVFFRAPPATPNPLFSHGCQAESPPGPTRRIAMLRAINISQRITFFVILMIAMTIAMAVLSFFMTSSVINEGTVVSRNQLLA